ncbi:MAG: prepilin-type N-terminal cleavage/methylation domain-containing protein [Deltaproteobacteria bacterium]|nr:prepilin-type N-terminal cleavage/methylation domain-containing protein [Deltaproteobacteria bacterium]
MARVRTNGFTLIEVMVVVILIAIITAGAALGIGSLDQAKLRSSCWMLASAARFAYSRAVTQGTTVRLALDFEGRTMQVQETKGRVVLSKDDESGEGLPPAGVEGADAGVPSGGRLESMDILGGLSALGGSGGKSAAGETGGAASGLTDMMSSLASAPITDPFLASLQGTSGVPAGRIGYRGPKFAPLPGKRGEPRSLEGDTIFKAVYTPHEQKARTDGKAYIYFFPGGMTEHSIVQLSDGGDRTYSVEIHPLSGRAIIHREAVEPEDDLDKLQEAAE